MNGYPGVYDFEMLAKAANIASDVLKIDSGIFYENFDENIIQLQNELIWKTYTPAAPFDFRDITAQVALCLTIDASLIPLAGKKDLFIELLNHPLDADILGLVHLFFIAFNL